MNFSREKIFYTDGLETLEKRFRAILHFSLLDVFFPVNCFFDDRCFYDARFLSSRHGRFSLLQEPSYIMTRDDGRYLLTLQSHLSQREHCGCGRARRGSKKRH